MPLAVASELPRRLETGDADFLVEVARAASLFGHVQRVDAFPFARGDDERGLPDRPFGVGLAVLVEDELRGELLAGDGVAVGAGRVAGERLQHDALHVAGVAGGGVAEGEEHVPARVAWEVGVGEVVNLWTPGAVHARIAELLHQRVGRAVVGNALCAVCCRESRERVGLQHANLRCASLRKIELAVVAEEPRICAALAQKHRGKRLHLSCEGACCANKHTCECSVPLHANMLP